MFCEALLQTRHHEIDNLSIALITSDWHMARAWMIASKHFPRSVRLLCSPQMTNLQRFGTGQRQFSAPV